jgi:uncharacterized protein
MPIVDVAALTAQVLWAVFILSVAFGVIAERSHFCTMGAVADVVNFGDWRRLRMWALAVAVAVIGFNVFVALGWVAADRTIYGGSRWMWASALSGGLMFGVGMVLASGCGSRNLVRLGGGSLKALVVLLVIALTAWMTLRGLTASWRTQTVDRWAWPLASPQDLPTLIGGAAGWPVPWVALGLGLLLGGALLAWVLWQPEGREARTLFGGLGIGAVVLAVWWVSARHGHLLEHPETLEEAFLGTGSRRPEALSFVAPLAQGLEWLVFYTDQGRRMTTGMAGVGGLFVGSMLAHAVRRGVRLEGFRDATDTANHLVGATLMGVGGVTALGCTIGQGISGVSTLGLTSLLATAALIGGAVLGLRFLSWQLERSA